MPLSTKCLRRELFLSNISFRNNEADVPLIRTQSTIARLIEEAA